MGSPSCPLYASDQPLSQVLAITDEPPYELFAVDAQGRETKLDRLKQTAKSEFGNSDSGFGIGILH
jgi:hypothetical protein